MQVSEILTKKGTHIVSVGPDETIVATIQLLKGQNTGTALVLEGDHIAGIISERDIVRDIAAHGVKTLKRQVKDVMTTKVITCNPTDILSEVMTVMTEHGFRHLPVTEKDVLTGIISVRDVIGFYIEELRRHTADSQIFDPSH